LTEVTTKLVPCQVGIDAEDPCPRSAEVEILGVAFCRPCARQQEAYFAIGELTHEEGRNLRSKLLADVEARKGQDDVEHRGSRSLGRGSKAVLGP
jgi:hypothetical protein